MKEAETQRKRGRGRGTKSSVHGSNIIDDAHHSGNNNEKTSVCINICCMSLVVGLLQFLETGLTNDRAVARTN